MGLDINDAWKATCRIVLGGEIGELKTYEAYLTQYVEPIFSKKSALGGQSLPVSVPYFCPAAKFISLAEQDAYNKKISDVKLNLNQIKDIESILSEISPHFFYAADQVTGNSFDVAESDNIIDSQVVYKSQQVWSGKFVAYSSLARLDEYIFGVNWSGEAKYLIRCFQTYRQQRCFETNITFESSDCHYTSNLWGCSDCLFTFNQRNRRHLIGNLALEPSKYLAVKKSLLEQVRSELKSKKNTLSILDILGGADAP
ncbi:Uncharacterised protein [uncultured archaeon]|nr:Uncharacterised protein [uncultured archaeon]